ncbi:AAA family ATPase [Magnetospirillum sp. SS-4]|uniref:AAA family ATPase n=1 Tax=Magnetospirillum sp. SS-4 TaxID=2681465 RepID=UPI00137FC2A6|nr:AAA family ATPase [Magnetospirillum sp. SS-4]CAA7614298.1 Replication factor C small subunit [Magnetospirillum sp. SS-4]
MVSFVTKYKPKCLADVVYPDTDTEIGIKLYENAVRFNHIILHGTFGTGKTTVASLLPKAVVDDVDEVNDVRFINGSMVRGINEVRAIEDFLNYVSWNKIGAKFVIIDEAEQLTAAAQFSLKGVLDEFIESAMFIFTTNTINKLDGGIQSRSEAFLFDPLPVQQLVPLVKRVLNAEGLSMSDQQIKHFAETHGGSVRGLLMQLESMVLKFKLRNRLRTTTQTPSPNQSPPTSAVTSNPVSCNTTPNQSPPTSAATSNPVSCNPTPNQSPPTSAATSNPVSCNPTPNQSPPSSQAA